MPDMTNADQPPSDAEGHEVPNSIRIDLNGISGRVSRDLKRIILLASAGLQNIDKIDTENLNLPVEMKIQIEQDAPVVKDKFLEDFGEWILACGLRDAIEALSAALEEAHDVLSIWDVTNFKIGQAKIPSQEWQKIFVNGARDFHRFGLPVKLRHFVNDHDVALAENMTSHVICINTARNCLVHRGGIATGQDVTEPGLLKVSWRTADFFLQTKAGQRPLILGEVWSGPPWGGHGLGCGFDRRPGVLLLELRRARIAERGVQA